MARMATASSPRVMTMAASEFDCHLELVPKGEAGSGHWSIDDEPIGETWHDSSWMLRKGLDVIEDLDLDTPHRGWAQVWREPVTDIGFLALELTERS